MKLLECIINQVDRPPLNRQNCSPYNFLSITSLVQLHHSFKCPKISIELKLRFMMLDRRLKGKTFFVSLTLWVKILTNCFKLSSRMANVSEF